MTKTSDISLKQQNYVETIYELVRTNGKARTTDLADRLNVSLPSVSEAVTRLVKLQIAVRKSWHRIDLTRRGRAIAVDLEKRHKTLRSFMVNVLAMDQTLADNNACRVEHCIDPAFVNRLTQFADFVEDKMPQRLKQEWVHRAQH